MKTVLFKAFLLLILLNDIFAESRYSYRELGVVFNYGVENDKKLIANNDIKTAFMSYGIEYLKSDNYLPTILFSWDNMFGASMGQSEHSFMLLPTDNPTDKYSGDHYFEKTLINYEHSIYDIQKRKTRLYLLSSYSFLKHGISGINKSPLDMTFTPEGILEQKIERQLAIIHKEVLIIGTNIRHIYSDSTDINVGYQKHLVQKAYADLNENATYTESIISNNIYSSKQYITAQANFRFKVHHHKFNTVGIFRLSSKYSLSDNSQQYLFSVAYKFR